MGAAKQWRCQVLGGQEAAPNQESLLFHSFDKSITSSLGVTRLAWSEQAGHLPDGGGGGIATGAGGGLTAAGGGLAASGGGLAGGGLAAAGGGLGSVGGGLGGLVGVGIGVAAHQGRMLRAARCPQV